MSSGYLETTNHTIAWFLKRNQSGELLLRPPFQRQSVWSDRQKSYLIDTILHEYPIPELYIQESIDEFGNEEYIVVDGQQRIRACIEFESGNLTLDGEDSPEFANLNFDDLSPGQRQAFYGYKFIVRKLPAMSDRDLRGIFTRINRNTVQLNSQELRHATYWGHFIKTAELLASLRTWSTTGVFSPNDVRRMLNAEFVSELMLAFLYGPQNKKANLDKAYAAFESEFPRRAEVERVFRSALAEIVRTIPDISQTRWRKKSDFYTLFLAFVEVFGGEKLTEDQHASLGQELRRFGEEVNDYIKGDRLPFLYSDDARLYVDAVERAASDMGSRKRRHDILTNVIANCCNP